MCRLGTIRTTRDRKCMWKGPVGTEKILRRYFWSVPSFSLGHVVDGGINMFFCCYVTLFVLMSPQMQFARIQPVIRTDRGQIKTELCPETGTHWSVLRSIYRTVSSTLLIYFYSSFAGQIPSIDQNKASIFSVCWREGQCVLSRCIFLIFKAIPID